MHCPFCHKSETKVIDSRLVSDSAQVRRRRECLDCAERFTTYETAELALPRLVKRDGQRVSFNEANLRAGILRAIEKRPVNMDQVDAVIYRLKHRLRTNGDREVNTQQLGEWVMEELRALDEVAYVRFASVYRRFKDVQAFQDEINKLYGDEHTGDVALAAEALKETT